MTKEQLIQSLADEIQSRHMQLEDRYEIAAQLESMGWNDSRAAETFGVDDVFELADVLWQKISSSILFTPFAEVKKLSPAQLFVLLFRQFLRGVLFAIPMAISVVSMLTLKFSLWSYENLTVDLATGIAIGTIISFVVVGGFTQAIARRGFFYVMQGYYNMGRKITFYFIGIGFVVCIGISVFIVLFNLVFSLFSYQMLMIIVAYFFFLNSIWLSVTIMYILRKELLFSGLIVAGIGIVFLFYSVFGVNIIVSQLIALLIVSVASMLLVSYLFKRAESKMEKGIAPQMPLMSITLYSTIPYFIYGLLYFGFLFVDRMIAWSTNDEFMPFLIWFRGNYELGLDFSLLLLIIPMGISEMVVSKLMTDLESSQKAYWGNETDRMNRMFLAMYFKRLVLIAAISTASAFLFYWGYKLIFDKMTVSIGSKLFEQGSSSHFVLVWSMAAYVILAVALMNAVILFSVSQPWLVIRSIWPAFLVNVTSGFLLSRWEGHIFAVIGLFAGCIVFAVLSTRSVIGMMKKLDYYLYAAS
jgi:hypothetical protein